MVYRFELKRQLTGILLWAFVLAAVLWLLVYGFYPIFLDCRPIMENYIASFPAGFAEAFGFNLDDLFGMDSFFSLVYLYEALLGAIMMTVTAVCVFGREKKEKCADFLMTKPVSRSVIFGKKLLGCLTLLVIGDLPYLALFLISRRDFGNMETITGQVWLSMLCLPLTQLVFLSIGIFAAVFLRRIRSAAGLGTGIGMFAFLLSVVHSLTEKEAFKFLSPLFYFSPQAVADTGGYDVPCLVLAVTLMLILTGAAFWKYTREDLTV